MENTKIYKEDEIWMKPKDVRAYLGISASTLGRWVAGGKIPAPRKPSRKIVFYAKSDLDDYIRKTASDEKWAIVTRKTTIDKDIERLRGRPAKELKSLPTEQQELVQREMRVLREYSAVLGAKLQWAV